MDGKWGEVQSDGMGCGIAARKTDRAGAEGYALEATCAAPLGDATAAENGQYVERDRIGTWEVRVWRQSCVSGSAHGKVRSRSRCCTEEKWM